MYMAFTFIPNSPTGWDRIFLLLFWEKSYVLVWTCNLPFLFLPFLLLLKFFFFILHFVQRRFLKWFSISAQNWNLQWHWRGYSSAFSALSLSVSLSPFPFFPPNDFVFLWGGSKVDQGLSAQYHAWCMYCKLPYDEPVSEMLNGFYGRHLCTAAIFSRGTVRLTVLSGLTFSC